ncbi:MAG: recombinase family protein, partial [Alphaproteobacteria bacterium]
VIKKACISNLADLLNCVINKILVNVIKKIFINSHSIDRLARNINDLLQIVKTITEERHAEIYFIKENLRFTDDTNNPFNKLTLQIIGSIAEFERNMIKMRQAEGIAIAKQKGVYSKERCKKISLTQQEELKNDIKNKVRVCEILKKYGITKPTYYRCKENFGL